MKKLITVKEVSDLLQLNERTVLKMLQNSDLPGIRIGSQWRIHPVLLEDWFMRRSGVSGVVPSMGRLEFRESHIVLDLALDTREQVLTALIDRLVSAGDLLYPDLYLSAVLDRERMLSTGVGNGVALPHAQLHAVTQTFSRASVVMGRLKTPLAYDAVDGLPVDLFFLVASPPTIYLECLALVNAIARQPRVLEVLRAAGSQAQAAAYLTAAAADIERQKGTLLA